MVKIVISYICTPGYMGEDCDVPRLAGFYGMECKGRRTESMHGKADCQYGDESNHVASESTQDINGLLCTQRRVQELYILWFGSQSFHL